MSVYAAALTILLCLALFSGPLVAARPAELPRLRVSETGHFLVHEDGSPFFWLGDTAWWIRRITPGEVDLYLSTREKQGFTIIQIAPASGFSGTDYAGNRPFLNDDTDTPDEAFWHNIDTIVDKARDHGLYILLFPLWGDDYNRAVGADAQRAHRLGLWLGRRYADRSHVLWAVSGEYDAINGFRLPISEAQKRVLNAMARGLQEGHGNTQLMTIHPGVARTSSLDFHGEAWLNLNMLQSGHVIDAEAFGMEENHALIARDYALTPTKPVLDGEPMYEDTPDAVWVKGSTEGPRGGAEAMRRKAYWAVFAGACGHTYGHNDIYGFFVPSHPGQVVPLPQGPGQRGNWKDALAAPGGAQMQHLRALIESRPFLTRIPDQSLVAPERPREGKLTHLVYARDAEGKARLYVDGRLALAGQVGGRMDNWDAGFRLALANELTQDRPWLGEYRLIAVYDRALDANEMTRHFRAGAGARPEGALVLYTFAEGKGDKVRDVSGTSDPLDLKISDPSAVEWVKGGGLAVGAPVLIISSTPAAKVTTAVGRSGAITIEAWVTPTDDSQAGPARIVTLSQDPGRRSFTLGQDRDGYEVRLRTTATAENGLPGLATADHGMRHVQATRDANGSYAMIYVPAPDQTVTVDTSRLSGKRLKAWWYDPRTGKAAAHRGEFPAGGKQEFTSPAEGLDWVLVLDDVAKEYPRPASS